MTTSESAAWIVLGPIDPAFQDKGYARDEPSDGKKGSSRSAMVVAGRRCAGDPCCPGGSSDHGLEQGPVRKIRLQQKIARQIVVIRDAWEPDLGSAERRFANVPLEWL